MVNKGIAPLGYFERYYSTRGWTAYVAILSRLIIHSKPGPILDMGAGCGYFVEAAYRWGMECTGLDGAVEGVLNAKSRVPELDMRLHSLSEKLPFSDNVFQTVVLNQVIEHLESEVITLALSEVYRVLNHGGMVLVTSPSCYNDLERKADPTHINLLSPSGLRAFLGDAGFINVHSFDDALPIFGKGNVARSIANILYKLIRIERLSGTANAFAYKL